MQLTIYKAWRCIRRSPKAAWSGFVDPVFNTGQALSALVAVIGLFLILQTASAQERDMQAEQWAIGVQAFGYALIGWAIISILRAPILVWRDDRQLGKWDGHRFIFHRPVHVLTTRVEALDGATTAIPFVLNDAEPNSMVYLSVEALPAASQRIRFRVNGGPPNAMVVIGPVVPGLFDWTARPGAHCGIRIPRSKQATLYVRLEPETVPVTLRVECDSFFIGKSDEQFA